jgi:cytochrome c biogenesis protein CcmG, thiol:disulfide interchange protein DsbE
MSRMREFGLLVAFVCTLGIPAQAAKLTELDALHGRVVYLDFWASWCEPCRRSFPWMQQLKHSYESRGLTVIAVNLDRDRADAEAFLERFHPDFQIRFDPEGQWAERFQIRGMPTSVVIDRHGVARFTHVGFRSGDGPKYARQIEEVLAEH